MKQAITTCLLLFGFLAPFAGADLVEPGIYTLANHPSGNAADPHYGFRLDELIDVTSSHDIFTFDFDHVRSNMRMNVVDTGSGLYEIRIFGEAFGGLDIGQIHDPNHSGVWTIDFTYKLATLLPSTGREVTAGSRIQDRGNGPELFRNEGSIRQIEDFNGNALTSPPSIGLWDEAGSNSYTFRLDHNHRGHAGLSGWGWVNHTVPDNHVYASDWLFTANPIPAPGAALLGLMGMFVIDRFRRRKTA